MAIEGALREKLTELVQDGPPQVSALAAWMIEHPEKVAFKSVRALAGAAEVNSNTVVRLARALGFSGFDACREAFREALLAREPGYSARAAELSHREASSVQAALRDAQARNAEAMFSVEMSALTDECAEALVGANRVFSVGVRSCLSVSHYFNYVGAMAFENIAPLSLQPGSFIDAMAGAGADDVVLAISFKHYSMEVVRACETARKRGARVIAMTDSRRAPIAADAWRLLLLQMAGPQYMPSLLPAFLLVEILLAKMTALSPGAAERIDAFERRVMQAGGYLRG